jgi:hypothetical protein
MQKQPAARAVGLFARAFSFFAKAFSLFARAFSLFATVINLIASTAHRSALLCSRPVSGLTSGMAYHTGICRLPIADRFTGCVAVVKRRQWHLTDQACLPLRGQRRLWQYFPDHQSDLYTAPASRFILRCTFLFSVEHLKRGHNRSTVLFLQVCYRWQRVCQRPESRYTRV